MDTAAKRRLAEGTRRRLTRLLRPAGLARTKPAWWTRPAGPVVEFVYLHLFSFAPKFRVHIGLRVLNDPFDAIALNGPTSDGAAGYALAFDESPESLERAAAEVARYCAEVGEPWWAARRPPARLLGPAHGLPPEAAAALSEALAGRAVPARVAQSRALLGVA